MLMKIAPSVSELPNIQARKFTYEDPIMVVDITFLKRISLVTLFLEIIYKFIQYSLIFLLSLVNKTVVVDEGPSLGWANYLNLMLNKKALKPHHVDLLMRLDLQFSRTLSRLCGLHVWFIDRSQKKLGMLWQRKGRKSPYGTQFAFLVRYSFKLFEEASRRQGIDIMIQRLYFS
jgi:hypothetical protein